MKPTTLPKHRQIEQHDMGQINFLLQLPETDADTRTVNRDLLRLLFEKQNELIQRVNEHERIVD